MASIIPGYNYDIFISYRQKDNKGDRWVSKFVEALKTELEATFKEDVTVYFDENPHDRLQETYDVEKSLEGKLRCLIFIPILSQTYCDPKSYAWQNEFLTFLNMVKNDRFVRDIKLRSGNVASRILPIRIHDLEPEDIKLFERETGSVLRSMDFVFKTGTGAIRPLLPNEDHPNDNLYKTFYRDQISKVAIAIKELILGMKEEPAKVTIEKNHLQESLTEFKTEEITEVKEKPAKTAKVRFLIPIAIIAILIIAGIISNPKIFKIDTIEKLRDPGERISVAVMPFQNMTTDTSYNIWQLGLQNLLITSLSNSEELSVRQYETMEKVIGNQINYASISPSFAADVALKLEAKTVIFGSIYKNGNKIRITANLMNSISKEINKSFTIDGSSENDFFPIIDSLSKLTRTYLEISKLKNKYEAYEIKDIYTASAEAFKYYIQARAFHGQLNYSAAVELYYKSLKADSNFVSPMLMLTYVYGDMGKTDESKKWAYEAYERIEKVPFEIQLQVREVKAAVDKKPEDQIKYTKQYLEFNPYSTQQLYTLGWVSFNTYQWQSAIDAFEKGIELNKQLGNRHKLWIWNYVLLGNAYHKIGEHKKENKIYEDGLKLWPNEIALVNYHLSICLLSQKDTDRAKECMTKITTYGRQNNWPESKISSWLAGIYYQADLLNKANEFYTGALKQDPQNKALMNEFAYFLIDKGIDEQKGIDLIKGVIREEPDNYDYLYTYGAGLLKQNKIEEALNYLNKSWELRPFYDHQHFQFIEAAKKAIEDQKK